MSEDKKQITFEVREYTVPVWVEWVARDDCGDVYGFKTEPMINISSSQWVPQSYATAAYVDDFILISKAETNWRDSLTKV